MRWPRGIPLATAAAAGVICLLAPLLAVRILLCRRDLPESAQPVLVLRGWMILRLAPGAVAYLARFTGVPLGEVGVLATPRSAGSAGASCWGPAPC